MLGQRGVILTLGEVWSLKTEIIYTYLAFNTIIVTKRTKASLTQFLDLFSQDVVHVLLEKHGVYIWGYNQIEINNALSEADRKSMEPLIEEVVITKGDLRNRVNPRYRFDERWNDLEKCLLLDGYRVEGSNVVRIEPVIESTEPVEDDLTKELQSSHLSLAGDVIRHINLSAEAFRRSTPDYNGCLSHARIALETLVRAIAKNRGLNIEASTKAWRKSLSHLVTDGFFNTKEERAIASSYTLISDGTHVPIGFTKEEFARFGRNLATSVCYFIVKKFNGE